MTIKDLVKLCHDIAVEKGFWNKIECKNCDVAMGMVDCNDHWEKCPVCEGKGYILERNDGELIALMHSELSEALEELRKNPCNMNKVGEELSDCVIRIFDYCGGRDIDLQTILTEKIEKNKKRPFKHGKQF